MLFTKIFSHKSSALALLVTHILFQSGATFAESRTVNLLDYPVKSKVVSTSSASRSVSLNPKLDQTSVGDALSVGLPDGRTLTLNVTQNKRLTNGDTLLKGADNSGNKLILTIGKSASFGNIYGDDMRYMIGFKPRSGAFIFDETSSERPVIDLRDDGITPPNRKAPLYTRPSLEELSKRAARATKPGDSIITILAVYSPQFAAGFGAPESRINQMIEFTNSSLTLSNIDIQLQLIEAVELNFNNNTDNGSLLTQATNGVGAFSQVEQIRNDVGADLVTILTFQPGNSASGVAWVNGDQDRFAYSVVQSSPNCCDSVFAHEIGHNLGSGHERAAANPGRPSPCNDFNFTGFSCGHGQPGRWGTMMSRLSKRNVDFVFSNPNLDCLGSPCGIPEGQANSADNFRSFNISGPLTAAFRESAGTPPTPPVPPSVPNGQIPMPSIYPLLLEDDD